MEPIAASELGRVLDGNVLRINIYYRAHTL